MKFLAVILLLVAVVFLGFGMYSGAMNNPALTGNPISTPTVYPQDFDNHALDTVKEVAESGYKSIVAVAVSGDVAQMSMTNAFVSGIWGIAVIIIATIFATIYFSKKKESANGDNSRSHQYQRSESQNEWNIEYDNDGSEIYTRK